MAGNKKKKQLTAKEDEEARTNAETRNQADSLIFTAEKTLKDNEGKVPEELKTEVEEKVKALKDILTSGSKEEMETKTKELSDSLQKVGQQMSSQQSATDNQQPDEEGSEATEKKDPSASSGQDESASADASEDKPVEGEVVN